MAYYGDNGGYDIYGRPLRRPSPHHMRSDNAGFLDPGYGGGLHRSRSTGARPMPQINVYNKMYQDNENRTPSPMPYPVMPPVMPQYVPYPVAESSRRASPRGSPAGRGRSRSRGLADGIDGLLTAELADMAIEHRYGRSRSRGRSDAPSYTAGLAEYQLAEQAKELRRLSQERQWRLEEEKLRNQIKLEAMAAESKREREEREAEDRKKRIEEDWERRLRIEREKKDAAEKAAVEEYERKQREAKKKAEDAERAVKEKIEREAREKKQKDKELYEEFKRREKEEEEKQKREWEEFERKRKEKEEKEKKKKADEEKAFQEQMRERLRALGYTEQTIDIMVDKEKTKNFQQEVNARPRSQDRRTTRTTTQQTLVAWDPPARAPVYPKVHKDYIELKTLEYYQLPWHYDRDDPDFIIIQRDMDKRHTDVLFEHTARIRKGALLLEAPKKEQKFAMYRKRSRSRHGHGAVIEKGVLRLA
ncbi:hypothetical protein CKM354_000400700 [Cercospora kikuchii]|uniref:Reticulocyte-binding protein 2-like protein a n=1 Tax=Cercospora kikuchii TaxID=84275 RepID=A0A9P3FFC8_9PEZI|nr:uncharacterized protein CKM354_000400700 [Cercospora kikuchii]GIZ40679.1 hypothetical protein CKM354_000400700 [Cercospora kikuchii]